MSRIVDVYGQKVTISDAKMNDYVFDGCEKRNWKPELYAILDKYLWSGMGFVDIGPFVGSITLYAAALGCRVIAAECDPEVLKVLHGNVALNPTLIDKVHLEHVAVGTADGHAQFGARGKPGSGKGGLNFVGEGIDIPVETVTLPTLVRRGGMRKVCFLKLNAQGTEGPILWAGRDLLLRDKPDVHVYIRPENWRNKKENWETLIAALKLYRHVYREDGTPFEPDDIATSRWMSQHDYKLLASDGDWRG